MIIRDAQMKALDLAARLSNLQPYIDHVKECHPDAVKTIGEPQLPAHISAALTKAFGYGIETTPDYFRFLDVASVFGVDWTKDDLKWMDELMSDKSLSEPSARLDKLFLRAMYKLEGAAGDSE